MSDVGRHVEDVRVAWADTDAGGRIHFTVAFRYAERAETPERPNKVTRAAGLRRAARFSPS